MKKSIVGLLLALFASLAWALPTVQQVEEQTKQGHYAQAETMMAEVVAARPDSARAHYVYAEILAHNANFKLASQELSRAKLLDPKVGFTTPEQYEAFDQLLRRELGTTTGSAPLAHTNGARSATGYAAAAEPVRQPASSGIPGWVWLAGLLVLGVVLWRGFNRSRNAAGGAAMAPAGYGPGGTNQGTAYGPGPYGPGPSGPVPFGQQGGAGSGLLKTGLAVGAGVAGGMLIDEMLHRRNDGSPFNPDGNANNHIGGFDPDGYRPSSDQAASDLENRSIDFGSGGDDWGGGGGDSGGGDDSGGGW